ncbi:MAG: thiamine phosphate synthase [Rhizomicrobium sp.]
MTDSLARRKLASAAARLNASHRMAGELPPLALFTDDDRLADPLGAARALPRGAMVVVRAREAARRDALARSILALGRDLVVLVADDPKLAARVAADGLHLPARRAKEAAHWRARFPRWLITAAAHGPGGGGAHLDALFLSAVFATRSHPGRAALTAVRANAIARASRTPVYALGGVEAGNARLLHGFVGIAAIGALAPSSTR